MQNIVNSDLGVNNQTWNEYELVHSNCIHLVHQLNVWRNLSIPSPISQILKLILLPISTMNQVVVKIGNKLTKKLTKSPPCILCCVFRLRKLT